MDAPETTDTKIDVDIAGVLRSIPHRYPFLLIDSVRDIEPFECATGIKTVTANEPCFQGHFPGHPIMPGVLIVEAMAQTAAVFVVQSLGLESEGKLVYFMSIEGAKFRKPVLPGDLLQLHVRKLQQRGQVWRFKGEAHVDGKLVAEATISAMIRDP